MESEYGNKSFRVFLPSSHEMQYSMRLFPWLFLAPAVAAFSYEGLSPYPFCIHHTHTQDHIILSSAGLHEGPEMQAAIASNCEWNGEKERAKQLFKNDARANKPINHYLPHSGQASFWAVDGDVMRASMYA